MWEKGKATPSIDTFIAYCQACGTHCVEVLNEAVGDPAQLQDFKCTQEEAEMIRRYRVIDKRGKRNVRRVLDAEYNDVLASLPEESQDVIGHG